VLEFHIVWGGTGAGRWDSCLPTIHETFSLGL